jgi:ABC-type transporter Mla subunit MlaD
MRFRIGVFVLAALLLFAVLVMLFGSFPSYFKQTETYQIWFDNAPGVQPGTPVRRSGVRIGEVKSVQLFDDTGKVLVVIAVDKQHTLYEDDQPELVRGPLGSDITIDFRQKRASAKPAEAAPKGKEQSGAVQQVGFEVAQAPGENKGPPPAPHRVPAKPGKDFTGSTSADVYDLFNLAPPAKDAFIKMRQSLDRFDAMAPLMEETLSAYRDLAKTTREQLLQADVARTSADLRRTSDEVQTAARYWARVGERTDLLLQTNQDKVILTIDNLSEGSKRFKSISENSDELLKELRQTNRLANETFTQARDIMANLQPASRRLTEPGLLDRLCNIIKNLDEGTGRMNSVMAQAELGTIKLNRVLVQVEDLMRALDREDGTFRKILSDPALYNNLNDAAAMILRLAPRLDRILKDVEVFADKIARHPESLGIGGVVKPSAGLKEAPSDSSHYRGPTH